MKFKKEPIVIDAIQFTGLNPYKIERWINEPNTLSISRSDDGNWLLRINTLEGAMYARPGDWVIKGVAGEFYPCRKDVFEKTYERAIEEDDMKCEECGKELKGEEKIYGLCEQCF
jgi:hypothetical protein